MDAEEKLGQITAAVGRVCLRFKQEPEAPPPQGHVFAKCSFVGRGGPLFVPATPGADGDAPAAVDNAAGSPLLPLPSVQSEAVEIAEAVATSPTEEGGAAAVGDDDAKEPDAAAAAADGAAVADTASVVVVDMRFSLDTTTFDLADPALSMLEATEIKVELFFRSVGSGDDAETVIGTAYVRVADILCGKNEWTDELALGAYAATTSEAAATAAAEGGSEADGTTTADAADNDDDAQATAVGQAVAIQDVSLGPLEFGGSTSTVQVTLITNDETADYTVGAGSLWADGAEVTGVPEGWKVVPPPETERSVWNETIAQILAAQPLHEYSIWWGGAASSASNENSDGQEAVSAFPAMRLDGGVLSYEPDEESVHGASTAGGDSAEEAGSQGQASTPASSRGAGSGTSASGSGETESTPQVLLDPPTGTWSVRFPSFRTKSTFLHRTSMRGLRRALSASLQGGSSSDTVGDGKPPTVQVFLERRERRPEPEADEGKAGGKNVKKGGAKKPAAGKKGQPSSEEPPPPTETPWLCRGVIDLSPLAQPGAANGAAGVEERNGSTSGAGGAGKSDGDSPLRSELRAMLALVPQQPGNGAVGVVPDSDPTKGGEETAAQASDAVAPAAEGVGRDDVNGDSAESPIVNEAEKRIEQMRASETTLFITFALSRPLVKATARQETAVSVDDVIVPSDVGPRKPPRDVDVELREELDAFVNASLVEYAKLFLEPGAEEDSQNMSAEDRENHLFYALNSGGLYHSFLARLKPRVQRIVRKRFGAVPTDAAEADAFISDLYVHLVEEAAVVLNHRIKNVETKATPSYITADPDTSLKERVEHLGMLADDAEARGVREEAAARHEDRIEAATAAAASLEEWRTLLAQSWEEYGLFSLRGGVRSGQHQQRRSQPLARTAAATSGGNNGDEESAAMGGNGDDSGKVDSNNGGTATTLAHAARCLEESLRVYHPGSEESLAAMSVLAAVSMEQGQLDRAWALLETVLEQRLPKLEEGADGYETDDLARLVPRRNHALRCIQRDAIGDRAGARRSLFLAVQSCKREAANGSTGAIVSDDEPGAPRRTPVRVMQDVCTWLLELGLPGMARRAFKVAEESERLAVKKAKERGLPTRTPITLRESSRRLQCCLILAEATTPPTVEESANVSPSSLGAAPCKPAEPEPEAKEGEVEVSEQRDAAAVSDQECGAPEGMATMQRKVLAERLAQEAVELAPGDPRPWQALAEACDAQGPVKATEAADAWAAVLDRMEEAWMASSNGDDDGRTKSTAPVPPPPLRVFMRLGALYATLGRTEEAKACFLRACRVWRAPGPWLGCGAACLRLEQWQEAEDALQHASRLDCNSPLVWGHLALLLLSMGEDRLPEADRALSQALCLGLADPSLLREIGNCYVAAGRLDAAEDALRKSLAADTSGTNSGGGGGAGGGGVGNPHTRRCLADVLSARNSTSQAIEEYRRVLEFPAADVGSSEREEVLARCGTLLRKVGRGDELDLLQKEAAQSSQMLAN